MCIIWMSYGAKYVCLFHTLNESVWVVITVRMLVEADCINYFITKMQRLLLPSKTWQEKGQERSEIFLLWGHTDVLQIKHNINFLCA